MKSSAAFIPGLAFLIIVQSAELSSQQKPVGFSLVPGTVIRHEPASSGIFVGAPSLVITPENTYVASLNFTSVLS